MDVTEVNKLAYDLADYAYLDNTETGEIARALSYILEVSFDLSEECQKYLIKEGQELLRTYKRETTVVTHTRTTEREYKELVWIDHDYK